jgi:subtilisin-like proprotein convertase family protein
MLKKTLLLLACCSALFGTAQPVTFSGTGGLPIPPGAPQQTIGVTQSPCVVSGVGVIGGCVSIENVEINLTHTWVGDIGILLIGPGGQVLELSTGNGGPGDNYTNTVFTDNTGQFITDGAPPYTGVFRPEGRVTNLNNPYSNAPPLGTHTFASTYNGVNADGSWTLYINDYVTADIGELISWSITFNVGDEPPEANAGPDVTICAGQQTTLTASGGDTYLWNTGETTPSITVSPSATSTYTVTVTGTCGSDTDAATVTVRLLPAVAFSVADPDVCAGACTTVTATFTGTAPFMLTYTTPVGTTTQTFSGNTGTFQVCTAAGAPPGSFSVQATALTDAWCVCQ